MTEKAPRVRKYAKLKGCPYRKQSIKQRMRRLRECKVLTGVNQHAVSWRNGAQSLGLQIDSPVECFISLMRYYVFRDEFTHWEWPGRACPHFLVPVEHIRDLSSYRLSLHDLHADLDQIEKSEDRESVREFYRSKRGGLVRPGPAHARLLPFITCQPDFIVYAEGEEKGSGQ